MENFGTLIVRTRIFPGVTSITELSTRVSMVTFRRGLEVSQRGRRGRRIGPVHTIEGLSKGAYRGIHRFGVKEVQDEGSNPGIHLLVPVTDLVSLLQLVKKGRDP